MDLHEAFLDPKAFFQKLREHPEPGELRRLWFSTKSKKQTKQLKPTDIRVLRLMAALLLGSPDLNDANEGVHLLLCRAFGCAKSPLLKNLGPSFWKTTPWLQFDLPVQVAPVSPSTDKPMKPNKIVRLISTVKKSVKKRLMLGRREGTPIQGTKALTTNSSTLENTNSATDSSQVPDTTASSHHNPYAVQPPIANSRTQSRSPSSSTLSDHKRHTQIHVPSLRR
jgi:hypothetical protein